MSLGKAFFGRYKKGGRRVLFEKEIDFFSTKKSGGEDFLSEKIREGGDFISTKKRGRRLFFSQIFPKTRPRYSVNFDRSLTTSMKKNVTKSPAWKEDGIPIFAYPFVLECIKVLT